MTWVVAAGLAGALSCGRTDRAVDERLSVLSERGRFRIDAVSDVDPVPVNRIHTWTVRVSTPDGAPVEAARILFDGDMPEHQHGLPTRPRVSEYLGDGRYRIEGVRFSMPGHWELYIAVQAGSVRDRGTLSLLLGPT